MQTSLYPFYPASRRYSSDIVHVIRDQIRAWKVSWLQSKFRCQRETPWPDRGYSVFGKSAGVNGLTRAFRYEIDRLDQDGLYNPNSRNLIIFGQPRSYRRVLKQAPPHFQDAYRIGMWVCEFETFPPDWKFALDIVNEIWTPSEFSARAIRKETSLPVKVVPHAVHIEHGPAMNREQFGIRETAFLRMAIMDIGSCPDRKNPLAHIAAWKTAFGDDPNCQLLIKARFSSKTKFVREALLNELANSSNIKLIEHNFTDVEMRAFQRMADVYLSLHRTEGYGLNIHEMLELGKPMVATGYSGNMDFMPKYENAFPVPFKLVPYSDPTRHYIGSNLKWAEVDVDAAAEALTNLHKI